MKKELFQRTFSRLTASGQAKEELLQMIESKNEQRRRPVVRAVRLTAIAAAAVCLLTVTAFAASDSFRAAVIDMIFPRYSQGELIEIDEGHRTGSFDWTDTLNTFLEKFDREGMGDGVTVKMADGFHKTVLVETEDSITVTVETSDPEVQLVVFLVRQDYGDTAGLWQVTSYSIANVGDGGNFSLTGADGEVRFYIHPVPVDETE